MNFYGHAQRARQLSEEWPVNTAFKDMSVGKFVIPLHQRGNPKGSANAAAAWAERRRGKRLLQLMERAGL